MPYKKYDPKVDDLKEGTKIRLAGREGVLDKVDRILTERLSHHVTWKTGVENEMWWTNLNDYPDLEIFVQPLTIPQRTKQVVLEKYLDPKIDHETFRAFLESLEVTND